MPDCQFLNIWNDDANILSNHIQTTQFDGSTVSSENFNSSVFKVITFPPEKDFLEKISRMSNDQKLALEQETGISMESGKHPLMHKTDTIDYAVVISGEIYLLTDESEILLKQGDNVVQRATNHAWSNRSNNDCVVAFVIIQKSTNHK
ncbi:cupin domain-containing protein [Cysteiniphilum sp. 6C5]|uniref:cupin domain-containing protein n=1 Tax=unclassified Cysteiniphilum TaxID=2610889 RepID=UPI003F863B01